MSSGFTAAPEWARAIVKVGDGRGFVVEGPGPMGPIIITAAHCLPHLPPAHRFSYTQERTYANLVGPLGQSPSVWAECFFADPVSDLAVIGTPETQELFEEADAYDALTSELSAFAVADIPADGRAWLFSLDGNWFPCQVQASGWAGVLSLSGVSNGIRGGMSGSPIVRADGAAVGVVCASSGVGAGPHTCCESNPYLLRDLPPWLLARKREVEV